MLAEAPQEQALLAMFQAYLSAAHVENIDTGCATAWHGAHHLHVEGLGHRRSHSIRNRPLKGSPHGSGANSSILANQFGRRSMVLA